LGHDAEQFNGGIHGHMYARPGDVFVFSVQYWDSSAIADELPRLLELNSRIWESQTGISLATFENGSIVPVAAGESLLRRAVDSFDRMRATLVPTSVTYELLELLGAQDPLLAEVARSCERLNRKNTALALLREQGVPVPYTLCVRRETTDELSKRLDGLPRDRRYILKTDGLSSGLGVYLGDGSGYDVGGLGRLLGELRDENRLAESFQIQEFVDGVALGAVAHFDGSGEYVLLSISAQRTNRGSWVAGHWDCALEAQYRSAVTAIFDGIAKIRGLRLLGSVGIDAIACGASLRVLEVNARHVGSRPIGWLLRKEARIAEHRRKSGRDCVDGPLIRAVDVDITPRIEPKALVGDRLFDLIESTVDDRDIRAECCGPPMVLPQGLDPFRPTRFVFVNDDRGAVRNRIVERLARG
jgi:glutathione synthase/RimK-type ligase-like ATP-grasp enzyme